MNAPLAGRTVWITRAAHQAAPWADAIAAAGGTPICEPLLAIEAPADVDAARRGLADAQTAHDLFATSSNAVRNAWALEPGFVPAGRLYAVGAATAAALEQATGRAVTRPDAGFSSESLLARDGLRDMRGRRAAILAGEGGRTALADTLAARGAQVEKIALYRRRWVDIPPSRLATIIGAADAVIVTSGEALMHLARLVERAHDPALGQELATVRLVAPSMRVVKHTDQRLNWIQPPLIVERIGGDAIVAALARVWTGNRE